MQQCVLKSLAEVILSLSGMCVKSRKNNTTDKPFHYGVFICDYQLNQLIPEGYSSVRLVAPGVYACPRYNAQNEIRLTLFNDKGEVIFENATCVGYGDEDAIPVVKGFTVGLIDRQGSWNAKNSKYTQETDD